MLVVEMMPWTSGIQICCHKLCLIYRRHMASLCLSDLTVIMWGILVRVNCTNCLECHYCYKR